MSVRFERTNITRNTVVVADVSLSNTHSFRRTPVKLKTAVPKKYFIMRWQTTSRRIDPLNCKNATGRFPEKLATLAFSSCSFVFTDKNVFFFVVVVFSYIPLGNKQLHENKRFHENRLETSSIYLRISVISVVLSQVLQYFFFFSLYHGNKSIFSLYSVRILAPAQDLKNWCHV